MTTTQSTHPTPDKKPLSFIQPRETKRVVMARDSRTSRLIGRLRLILPLAAVLVVAALFVWPVVRAHLTKGALMKSLPDLVIQNLHYTGIDSKNQPYSLTSLKATRPSGATSIYDLEKPEAEITLTNGTWIDGKAQLGRYDQEARKLWLGGNVQLFQDQGYQFTTEEAQVDLNDNNAWGEKPVQIQGDFGVIQGQGGFRLLDSGTVIVVKGPAHAILNLHQAPSSDKPAEAHK